MTNVLKIPVKIYSQYRKVQLTAFILNVPLIENQDIILQHTDGLNACTKMLDEGVLSFF